MKNSKVDSELFWLIFIMLVLWIILVTICIYEIIVAFATWIVVICLIVLVSMCLTLGLLIGFIYEAR